MNVYIIAFTSGSYMVPINGKVYKNLKACKKEFEKQKGNGVTNIKILTSNNWHEVEE